MGTGIKYSVPDWVKRSFVIFDIRALWRSAPYGNSGCQRVNHVLLIVVSCWRRYIELRAGSGCTGRWWIRRDWARSAAVAGYCSWGWGWRSREDHYVQHIKVQRLSESAVWWGDNGGLVAGWFQLQHQVNSQTHIGLSRDIESV